MTRYDFRTTRLYVDAPLGVAATVRLDGSQAHYLLHVLRLKPGEAVLLFNGRDGEWRGTLAGSDKRSVSLAIGERLREQSSAGDLHYLFAPLKHARLDYMVQKAVEMGCSRLQPLMTLHTQVTRVNLDRMRANAIEAAEQCGILTLPEIVAPTTLERAIAEAERSRLLIFCDEDAEGKDPIAALQGALGSLEAANRVAPSLAVLIGPEGGFAEEERAMVLRAPNVLRLALGPRILRADTAAVAALALVQSVLGHWTSRASAE